MSVNLGLGRFSLLIYHGKIKFHSGMRSGFSLEKMSLQFRNSLQMEAVNTQTM